MIKKTIALAMILMALNPDASAQEPDPFLKLVDKNNPEIAAFRKLLEAVKAEAMTGIAPADPFASFGYMPEKNEGTAIKKTWQVNQSLSFPAKYITQKKLSKDKIILAEQEFDLARLNILLEAKFLLIDLSTTQKTLDMLADRKVLYDKLKSGWKMMLDEGETTILDYNKILYELSGLSLKISRARTEMTLLKEKLLYMCGNESIPLFPVIEFSVDSIPDLGGILSKKETIHPSFLLPESEYMISLRETKLAGMGNLPEFQAGYQSEILPGETFSGPVLGITIPLWANSGKVKSANAMADHYAAAKDARLTGLRTQIRGEYENLIALRESIRELRNLMGSCRTDSFLDQALSSGEISLIDYFVYLESSFQTEEKLIELENEYAKTRAALYDHELLGNRQLK